MEEGYVCGFAEPGDTERWMNFVELVRDNFPGLVLEDYRKTLIRNIERRSALCVKKDREIVGVLLYSVDKKTLSCMAVHPEHRRRGVASAMIGKMIPRFPADSEIWVSTFREGDPMGDAPRALYKKFGFTEDALVVEFGYPNQWFVLRRE